MYTWARIQYITYVHGILVHAYLLKVLNGVLVWDGAPFWRGCGPAAVSSGSREAVDKTTTVVVALQSVAVCVCVCVCVCARVCA